MMDSFEIVVLLLLGFWLGSWLDGRAKARHAEQLSALKALADLLK